MMNEQGDSFLFDFSRNPSEELADGIDSVFNAAWRFDFSAPGFCVLDLGPGVGSRELRALMLDLRGRLSDVADERHGSRLVYRSLGRFDQQETTKFHLDGAPSQSLLMLGYEPSKVRSRLSFADYTRCAYDLGIEPAKFLEMFNPMYRKGEEMLIPYVTELPQPVQGHSQILLINNSSLPFSESNPNPLGVLHKAEIIDPDPSEQRIVNSIMLSSGTSEEVDESQWTAFATTDKVSRKFYG